MSMLGVTNCEDDDATWWTEDRMEQFQEEAGYTFPQSMLDEESDMIFNSPNGEKLK